MKLAGPREVPWQNRRHYFVAAAEAMRQVLVDHARKKAAGKRGGPDARRAAIDLASLPDPNSEEQSAGFLVLDDAISRLKKSDPTAAEVVRLRYFAGLSIEDTAAAMQVSLSTATRSWHYARRWLREATESGRV